MNAIVTILGATTVWALTAAAAPTTGGQSGPALQDSKELGALAASRIGPTKADPDFPKKLAAVLEDTYRLPGCKARGVGPLLDVALKLPGGRKLAFVFGYARGQVDKKPKRWFIAFSSSHKMLTPVEVPGDGTGDLPAFQSTKPTGIFWVFLNPDRSYRGRLLFFSAETEMELKEILASNGPPSLDTAHYAQYPQKGMTEILLHQVPLRYGKAHPGAFSVDPGAVQVNPQFIDTVLQNFEKIRDSVIRIQPLNFSAE